MTGHRKKLIEVALPLEAINDAAAKEKAVPRHGHPQTLHLWWARRPLAAARAVLFTQLVDDPSSWPELFPTEEAQARERQRLFRLIEELVKWENSNNKDLIKNARLEIARSHARGSRSAKAKAILKDGVDEKTVNDYLATELPPVHDPFAGGGTIPLEAQRLGLRAIASDLNPVAVMINKALIEIPPKFAGMPPVNPESHRTVNLKTWKGAQGLAEDVRYYGTWMRDQARKRIGHLYPQIDLPEEHGSGRGTIVAWLWARTVESPNPAFKGCHVPLVSSFWLSTKAGKEVWLDPVVEGKSYRFTIRTGKPKDSAAVARGTKSSRGANFTCILSKTPIGPDHVRQEGVAKRMRARLMAIVAESKSGRVYLPPDDETERVAMAAHPEWAPDQELPRNPRWFSPPDYGMPTYGDLFTPRQMSALTTFSSTLAETRQQVAADIVESRALTNTNLVHDYETAIVLYLAFCLSKLADWSSSICGFIPGYGKYRDTFARQAIPMTWDYAELNPFSDAVGNWRNHVEWVSDVLDQLPLSVPDGAALQLDASDFSRADVVVSTDPPYYDNIGYADLSDFFYVWLRPALRQSFPDTFATVLVPKENELVACPYRHGNKDKAEQFFLAGMRRVLQRLTSAASDNVPVTIYYAFRQSEAREAGTSSTGWETFLTAVCESGHVLMATWPMRTEREGRSNEQDTNALASSIVLVCRKRPDDAPTTTRGDFRRMLRKELPDALKKLQQGNIAPVDVAQASIGPGMAIFSRHKHVLEADGKPMTVRSALQLINEVLDEYLASGEGDFDPYTRFAITWYEQHGWNPGPFGEAETLAKARNVAVSGVVEAGICKSAAGKVRILKRDEMRPIDYDPAADQTPTVWEYTQHLIRNLETDGEEAAAYLLKRLGPSADVTRELAYRLYNTCERRKWAEDARSYNGLILAWPELEKLVTQMGSEPPPAPGGPKEKTTGKKSAAKKRNPRQKSLFDEEGDK